MYMSIQHLCFYSYLLGKELKLCIRWRDVTAVECSNTLILPDSIKVATREADHYFSLFLHKKETHQLMEQLVNITVQQLINDEEFCEDKELLKKSSSRPLKNSSFLKRDLEARSQAATHRSLFRLPASDKLDGSTSAQLWLPYSKSMAAGTLYISPGYICFQSKVRHQVSAVIPLRLVHSVERIDRVSRRQGGGSSSGSSSLGIRRAIFVSTRPPNNSFLFNNVADRDFVCVKLAELMGRSVLHATVLPTGLRLSSRSGSYISRSSSLSDIATDEALDDASSAFELLDVAGSYPGESYVEVPEASPAEAIPAEASPAEIDGTSAGDLDVSLAEEAANLTLITDRNEAVVSPESKYIVEESPSHTKKEVEVSQESSSSEAKEAPGVLLWHRDERTISLSTGEAQFVAIL